MIQNSHKHAPGTPPLQAVILDEIATAPVAQVTIDELALAMATHPGFKRHRNEDRLAIARIAAPNANTYTVAIVCDGVGGSELGEQAAMLAISSIIDYLSQLQRVSPLKELAVEAIRRADDCVRNQLFGRGATTLVMLLATTTGHLVCANVGDSRAYSWDPTSSKLDQVTVDDTIENELKDLPGNPGALIKAHGLRGRLSQALGENGRTADELRVQTYTKECFRKGAVLGSDGLWRAARDFEATVANATTPTDAVRRAIALANWVGGVDNSSILAISDLERLFADSQGLGPHSQYRMGTTFWSPSAKVKFPTAGWLDEVKPLKGHGKTEKPKRSSKKKDAKNPMDEPQLNLETAEFKIQKPMIEVTVSEDAKKST